MKSWRESCDWQHLSNVVAKLKRDVEAAYFQCREADADAAHDDLLSAEWRLRQAERRRAK